MTVNDLIEILQETQAEGHGDREIFIAEQPSYPLAARFEGIHVEDEDDAEDKGEQPAVWLVSGANTPAGTPTRSPGTPGTTASPTE